MPVSYRPAGHPAVTPYLIVPDAEAALRFMESVLGAKDTEVTRDPGDRIRHASVRLDGSMIMVAEANAQWPAMSAMLFVYLPDVDAAYSKALAAGAQSLQEPRDAFYGDRSAGVKDANGIQWWLATHIEDVGPEEMERRVQAQYQREKSRA